jgi:hypothetical protein
MITRSRVMKTRSSRKVSETQPKTLPSKKQEDEMIKEMIMSKEYQEARQRGEDKALRERGEEYDAAWGGPPDPDHEGYHDISPMTGIENPFPADHQNLPKGDVSVRDLYTMIQRGFEKQEATFKSMLNGVEIRMAREISALDEKNT